MRISRFDRVLSNQPELVDLPTWDALVEHVGPHRFDYRSKDSVPLISPAEYLPGQLRRAQNVVRVHFGALDLDALSDEDVSRAVDRCTESGIAFLLYTTWSHSTRPNCARLFFPLTRPVEKAEWANFWPRMRAFFHNLSDVACSDASRIFYYPSAPAGTEASALMHTQPGAPLDVDALLRETATVERPRRKLTQAGFLSWVRSLRGRQSRKREWLRECGLKIIEGEPFAEEGDRDNAIFRFVMGFVEMVPDVTAESVLEIMRPSVEAMRFDTAVVLDKLVRALSQQVQADQASEAEKTQGARLLIRAAFRSDRDTPYSPDEIRGFAESMGCTVEELGRLWIVVRDQAVYFLVDGAYRGPYARSDMEQLAAELLSPASSAGVETLVATQKGIRPKNREELLREYGVVADSIALDMMAQRSLFHLKTRTLTEAPCPRRPILPEPSDHVARWLELLAGPMHHNLLLDWLASATRLDAPCSALYLEGSKGAGKTLLACGLAAIWSEDGPTSLEDAFSAFNQTLLRCPIVLADEAMPTDFHGRMKSTGYLRQFVQARSRTLKRKYVPDSTLRGCVRLLLAANHKDMISTTEHLTVQDIEAIVDRVLHIHVGEEPARYLEEQGAPRLEEIAAHVLWLAETRSVASAHRFLVTGEQTDLHRRLTTGSGLRSAVCHWLVSFLYEPMKIDATRSLLVRKHEGAVLASARGLMRHWPVYETNRDPPSMDALGRALGGLSSTKRLLKAGDGRPTWYWVIDTENLVAWAEDNGFADREQILDLLKTETAQTTEAN